MIPSDDYFEDLLSKIFSGECDAATLTTFKGIIAQDTALRKEYEAEARVHWLLVWKGHGAAGKNAARGFARRWWPLAGAAALVAALTGGAVLFRGIYAPDPAAGRRPARQQEARVAKAMPRQAAKPVAARQEDAKAVPPAEAAAVSGPPPAPTAMTEELQEIFAQVKRNDERNNEMTARQYMNYAASALAASALSLAAPASAAEAPSSATGLSGWLTSAFGNYTAATPGETTMEDIPGGATTGTVWKVTNTGSNMYSTNYDGGRFVFAPLHGDGETVARVFYNSAWTNNHGRAGVMFRETLLNNSSTVIFYRFIRELGNGEGLGNVRGQYRNGTDSMMQWQFPLLSNLNEETAWTTNDWIWVRIVRHGETFTEFYSTNEAPATTADWTRYSSCAVSLPENVNAGFFASHIKWVTYGNIIGTNWFTGVAVTPFVTPTNTADGIDISWVTAPAVTNAYTSYAYTISRGTSYDGPFTELAAGLTETHYLDTTAQCAKKYYYRVDALCDNTDTNLIGVSGGTRLLLSSSNLVSDYPQGYWYTQWSRDTPYTILSNGWFTSAIYPNSVSNHVHQWFGMLYTATLVPEATDDYYFMDYVDPSSAVTIWLDGQQVLANSLTSATYFGPFHLEAGRAVPLRILYKMSAATSTPRFGLQWGRTTTGTFAEIPVERVSPLPREWAGSDYGTPRQMGLAVFDATTSNITVTAGGSASAEEAGYFLSQLKNGACGLVTSFVVPADSAKAGLLLRTSLDDGAPFIACYATAGGIQLETRATNNSAVVVTPAGVAAPAAGSDLWLKMSSSGAGVGFYYKVSETGSWTLLTNAAFTASSVVYEGLSAQSGSDTASVSVTFRDTHAAELFVRVPPTDDAYVMGWNASSTNTNYGTATELIVKTGDITTTCDTLLKFDTAGFASVGSAKLRLYLKSKPAYNQATNEILYLCKVKDTAWKEESVTWASLAATTLLPLPFLDDAYDARFVALARVPAAGEFLEVDVTDAVRESAALGGALTLGIYTTDGAYNGSYPLFSSKEDADDNSLLDRRPYLVCSDFGAAGLAAAPGANAGEIALTWRFAQEDISYSVLRAASAEGPYTVIAKNVTGYTYYDTGLTAGMRYFYRVVRSGSEADYASAPAVSSLPDAVARGSMLPVADTYIKSDDKKLSGYRGDLVLKSTFSALGTQREAFFLFDLAGMANVKNARIRLTSSVPSADSGRDKSFDGVYFNVEAMDLGNWSARQSAICWTNSPLGEGTPWPLRKQELDWPDQRTTVRARLGGFAYTQQEIDITELIRSIALRSRWMTLVMYRVDTLNDNNCIFVSSESTTAAYRPTLLYSLGGDNIGDTGVTAVDGGLLVSWPTVTNALSYQVFRATAANGEYAALATGVTSTNYLDRQVSPGQRYGYQIRAMTASGNLSTPTVAASAIFESVMQRILPSSDTYIDQHSAADDSVLYKATIMNCKYAGGPTREDLFRFDVKGLATVGKAIFRFNLVPSDIDYTEGGVVVYDLSDTADEWDETLVSWNNPPLGIDQNFKNTATRGSNELGRFRVWSYGRSTYLYFFEVDATKAVRKAAAAGHDLVLKLGGDAGSGYSDPFGKAYFSVPSKENAYDLCRPSIYYTPSSAVSASIDTEQDAGTRGVTLSWRDVEGAESYTLTRTDSKGVVTTLLANATATSLTDTNLWNGAKYSYTYSLNANYADGTASLLATNLVHIGNTFTRYATEDTYLYATNSDILTDVHGEELTLGVKFVGTGIQKDAREAYVRFDVSNLPTVKKALMRLTISAINTDKDYNLVAESVEDTGWTETGDNALTWATSGLTGATIAPAARAANEALNRVSMSGRAAGDVVEFNITPLVAAARGAKKNTLVIHIYSDTAGLTKNVDFWSSERSSISLHPQILYTVPTVPFTGTVVMLM